MTRRGIASVCLLLLLLTAACGGDDDGPGGGPLGRPVGDGIVDLVRTLPAIPDADVFQIGFGDVEAIAEANGVADPDDLDTLVEWASKPVEDGVPIFLPTIVPSGFLAEHDEFEAELGVSLYTTGRFAGVDAAPSKVGVLDGDHDADDLTAALGEPDDGVWSVGGDELEVDIDERSAARPLGEALRLASADGRAVIASTAELARAAARAEGSLVDDALDAVLSALDDPDLVSGVVTRAPLDDDGRTTNGVAYGREGDEVVARLVLGHAGDDEAEEAVADVEDFFADDEPRTGLPWSDFLTVEDVSAEGSVVVVEVSFGPDQNAGILAQMLSTGSGGLPLGSS